MGEKIEMDNSGLKYVAVTLLAVIAAFTGFTAYEKYQQYQIRVAAETAIKKAAKIMAEKNAERKIREDALKRLNERKAQEEQRKREQARAKQALKKKIETEWDNTYKEPESCQEFASVQHMTNCIDRKMRAKREWLKTHYPTYKPDNSSLIKSAD